MLSRSLAAAVVFSTLACASGLPKGMIINPQWVDELAFEKAAAAPELGFAVTLPDRQWVAKRDYVYGEMMSFRLESPLRDAFIELLEYRTGEKAAGGPQVHAERLRKAYIGFGIEPSAIAAGEDGRSAQFGYEMRTGWTTKAAKRVIAVWLPGAVDTLLIFRGEWPPERDAELTPEMRKIVDSVRVLER